MNKWSQNFDFRWSITLTFGNQDKSSCGVEVEGSLSGGLGWASLRSCAVGPSTLSQRQACIHSQDVFSDMCPYHSVLFVQGWPQCCAVLQGHVARHSWVPLEGAASKGPIFRNRQVEHVTCAERLFRNGRAGLNETYSALSGNYICM